jgi:hypothetical protein
MVSISHIVKKIVDKNSFLVESISKGIISYGNLSDHLKPEIEKELGKKVRISAIVMALRRFENELNADDSKIKKFDFKGEILLRTNILDFNISKSKSLLDKIKNLYELINFERDTLNIILGSNEVSIVASEKYNDKLLKFLKGEKIITKNYSLVALTIIFDSEDFLSTPGVIFSAIRKLAWEQINIYEIISTMTELTFIISKKDSMKAYNELHELVGK